MTTLNLKKNIHKAIDKIEDAGLLQAVYTILEKQLDQSEYSLTGLQKTGYRKKNWISACPHINQAAAIHIPGKMSKNHS
jgi:hypothetical protein